METAPRRAAVRGGLKRPQAVVVVVYSADPVNRSEMTTDTSESSMSDLVRPPSA
jgi:hypothetical protein